MGMGVWVRGGDPIYALQTAGWAGSAEGVGVPPRLTLEERREGGWGLGPKSLCTKNGLTRFSLSLVFVLFHEGPFRLGGGGWQGCIGGGRGYLPPSRAPSLCLATLSLMALALTFVTDSNRSQLLWQPPPTAVLTASGAASRAGP